MARTTITTNVAGKSISSVIERTQEDARGVTIDLVTGKAGTLSTRTDADTGILTVASGHGITDTDTVAVFWEGGSRYNVDVTATTATTISIDVGSGTDLPVATTAVVVSKQSIHNIAIVGDSLEVFAVGSRQRVSVEFWSASPASLLRYDIPTSEGRHWVKSTDVTNPLAGDTVATVRVANGSTVSATLDIGILASTD